MEREEAILKLTQLYKISEGPKLVKLIEVIIINLELYQFNLH